MGIAINNKVPVGFALSGKSAGGLAVNGAVVWRKGSSITQYLTFQSDTAFTLAVTTPGWDGALYTSTNGSSWTQWDGTCVASSSGGLLYMAGEGSTIVGGSSAANAFTFTSASNLSCVGNIETLLDWETVANGEHPTMGSYCFKYLFYGCTSLTTAPSLPATTLAPSFYAYMFYGCTSLTTAPSLPATRMQPNCYAYMFYGCTSLTTAPSLPAISVITNCYAYMFYNCTRLKVASYQTADYPYSWPIKGETTSSTALNTSNMLVGTGGSFTGSFFKKSVPTGTYYLENEPV